MTSPTSMQGQRGRTQHRANGATAESLLSAKENSWAPSSLLFLELLLCSLQYAVVQKHGFWRENEKGSNEIRVHYRLQTRFWANCLTNLSFLICEMEVCLFCTCGRINIIYESTWLQEMLVKYNNNSKTSQKQIPKSGTSKLENGPITYSLHL